MSKKKHSFDELRLSREADQRWHFHVVKTLRVLKHLVHNGRARHERQPSFERLPQGGPNTYKTAAVCDLSAP